MNEKIKNLVRAGLLLALGIIIPYTFHMTGLPGNIFLPMHIPVLLCGFILGEKYGLLIGSITPIINSIISGMPPIYPIGICMAFELASYGLIAGLMYKNKKYNIFISLITAMIIGRLISGITNYILLTVSGNGFVLASFLTGSFIKGIWGIIIQLILIPIIIKIIENKIDKDVIING